jgi:SAM-dependent methyltransferase
MSDWLDSTDALAEQYADAENLNARIALHERYSTADRDFREWQFDLFDCPSDADVLAVGCGPADLWVETCDRLPSDWTVTLTDFSGGMVEEARENLADCDREFSFRVADAADLPFADDSFDAATANHMLYHVPDPGEAIAELRRVLHPDGTLYATTNGRGHMVEIHDVLESVLGERPPRATGFTLDNGRDFLERHFDEVEVRRHDAGLAVTDPDALVAYALSPDDVDDSLAPELCEAFEADFDDGVFRVTKEVGAFVARN